VAFCSEEPEKKEEVDRSGLQILLCDPLAWIHKTCLSMVTGSAFKGGEFAQHSLNYSVNLNERDAERERERAKISGDDLE